MKTPIAALLLLSLATTVCAQPQGRGQDAQAGSGVGEQAPDRPHGPPPEAVDACRGKAVGATCSFTGRDNEKLNGTCFAPPAAKAGAVADQASRPAACRPGGARQPGQ